ncbi:DUF2242 domain-containing protein [Undibacterium cyanobacteriorum]|uniref:DUF2242 domain-containing protein n=1 Tax=Undibacterium cyanobacteriorum TaxID=3073561 RepID=A0ABY9RJU7_9BURK|nr:DUF2242 domain-containing protein [Undibacterium sp. 20NA77.5]WMW81467.1 DUF2242 domain-containing protein [Undibacterium sp. 20NA77.5]
MQTSKICLISALVIAASACSTPKQTSMHKEEFGNADMFTYAVPGNSAEGCEAARRALMSQGYIISEANQNGVRGKRKFQASPESHVEVEFTVVCAANSKGSNTSTIFANAVRDQYALKKSSTSASLGVGGIGSISLPFGESNDSLVKVASETISDAKLYSRFYDLLERYMDDVRVSESPKEVPAPEAVKSHEENNQGKSGNSSSEN